MKKIFGVAIAYFTLMTTVLGDEWPAPKALHIFSEDGQYFVRIVPGDTTRNAGDPSAAHPGRYAHGEFYVRQRDRSYRLVADVALQNPINPVSAAVTNKGYLITFDNWHNAGYGKVVAMYTNRGKVIRAYTLEELYSQAQILDLPLSASSRWWRCSLAGGFGEPSKVTIFEHLGGLFSFEVEKGTFEYHAGNGKCNALGVSS